MSLAQWICCRYCIKNAVLEGKCYVCGDCGWVSEEFTDDEDDEPDDDGE